MGALRLWGTHLEIGSSKNLMQASYTLSLLVTMVLVGSSANSAESDGQGMKLLFSDSQDTKDPWGQLHFGATPMEKIRSCENPGFVLACCLPEKGGSWRVYGQAFSRDITANDPTREKNTWRFVRATTRDGSRFENVETLYQSEPGAWTEHLGLAYNPDANEFLALKLKADDGGFAYTAFFSPDGRTWRPYSGNPLFYDGDSLGLFWSRNAHAFVCTAKTLQPVRKHIQDHGGTHPQLKDNALRDRRVLAIRSSRDGRTWKPSDSLQDVWNRVGNYKPVSVSMMVTPDSNDPPDMEFYRGVGFWYHDRSYLVVLDYAASPLLRGKHGPQLDTEWWVSHDGLRWNRPYRGLNATGDGIYPITHNPMAIDGMLLFHYGNVLRGMKQDRISYVGARANAEFSSLAFTMPKADLALNAAVPSPDRLFAANQAYVMAAILDEKGGVIPGFEAEKCLVQQCDQIDRPLRWNGRSARELAGREIRLRFYLRGANIYAVTSKN